MFRAVANIFRRSPLGPDGSQYERTILGRIGRFISLSIFAIVIIVGAAAASIRSYYYVTRDIPKSQIEVTMPKLHGVCDTPSLPIQVKVVNRSAKTVEKMSVYFMARLPGRSTNYASYGPVLSDFIVRPGDHWIGCFPEVLNFSAQNNEKMDSSALIWSVKSFSVTFED